MSELAPSSKPSKAARSLPLWHHQTCRRATEGYGGTVHTNVIRTLTQSQLVDHFGVKVPLGVYVERTTRKQKLSNLDYVRWLFPSGGQTLTQSQLVDLFGVKLPLGVYVERTTRKQKVLLIYPTWIMHVGYFLPAAKR